MVCVLCSAQPHGNAIYIALQPVDFGVGVRVDHNMIYGSLTYGNGNVYRKNDLSNHVKATLGVLIPLKDYNGWKYDLTAGINYHTFNFISKDYLNPKIFNPWSFELGLTIKMKRFAIGMRTDILRWEPCVDIGIPLKF